MYLPAPPPNGTSQCPFPAALPSVSVPLPATRHSLPARVSSGAVSAPSGSGPYSTSSQHPLPALPPSLPSSCRSFSVSPFGQCSLPVVVELPGSPVLPGQISFPSCPSQRPFPWNVSSRAVFPHSGSVPSQWQWNSRAVASHLPGNGLSQLPFTAALPMECHLSGSVSSQREWNSQSRHLSLAVALPSCHSHCFLSDSVPSQSPSPLPMCILTKTLSPSPSGI